MLSSRSSLGCLAVFSSMVAMAQSAAADPVPVIAVNREIGLSVAGLFHSLNQDQTLTGPVVSNPPSTQGNRWKEVSHSRTTNWMPGLQLDASTMFDAFSLRHLYAAGQFRFGANRATEKYTQYYTAPAQSPRAYQSAGKDWQEAIQIQGEIGKGFLVLHDTTLVTPFVEGGYDSRTYNWDFAYNGVFFVGTGVKVDHALTKRLVLRGRFSWDEMLGGGNYYYNPSKGQSPNREVVRSRWNGTLGADYRLTQRLHLTTSVQYSYIPQGHASFEGEVANNLYTGNMNGFSNGVVMTAGVAWQL